MRAELYKIFQQASEMFDVPVDLVEAVFDVETLSEEEAIEKYGKENLGVINYAASKMGPNWYKEAKRNIAKDVDKISINHDDIAGLVSECVKRILEEGGIQTLEEGKLGRALGTLALGSALTFGGMHNANAQEQLPQNNLDKQAMELVQRAFPGDTLKQKEVYQSYIDEYSSDDSDKKMFIKILQKEVTSKSFTENDLKAVFPQAYADAQAGPDVWKANQNKYVGEINGQMSITGKIAASRGENPWQAILNTYLK